MFKDILNLIINTLIKLIVTPHFLTVTIALHTSRGGTKYIANLHKNI